MNKVQENMCYGVKVKKIYEGEWLVFFIIVKRIDFDEYQEIFIGLGIM